MDHRFGIVLCGDHCIHWILRAGDRFQNHYRTDGCGFFPVRNAGYCIRCTCRENIEQKPAVCWKQHAVFGQLPGNAFRKRGSAGPLSIAGLAGHHVPAGRDRSGGTAPDDVQCPEFNDFCPRREHSAELEGCVYFLPPLHCDQEDPVSGDLLFWYSGDPGNAQALPGGSWLPDQRDRFHCRDIRDCHWCRSGALIRFDHQADREPQSDLHDGILQLPDCPLFRHRPGEYPLPAGNLYWRGNALEQLFHVHRGGLYGFHESCQAGKGRYRLFHPDCRHPPERTYYGRFERVYYRTDRLFRIFCRGGYLGLYRCDPLFISL